MRTTTLCALFAGIALPVFFSTGCRSTTEETSSNSAAPTTVAGGQSAPMAVASGTAIFRVKAGLDQSFTDSAGNVWLADQGFDGGDVIQRDDDLQIGNTTDPTLFRTEHYGMNSFSCKIPNGKYLAKLYFAETFDGITGPGQRVFSFNVQGHEFKDFDVWVKAGGPDRALVESVPVEVTNGIFRIDFTTQVENPEINAIEIIPQS